MKASSSVAPGPRGAPLVGVSRELRRDPLGTLERARREHGDVVRLVLGPGVTRHALFHPDGVRHVLAGEADGYRKDGRVAEELRWTFGEGLLNSQDERWRCQRRLIQPLFTRPRIAGYADVMADEAAALVARWRRHADTAQAVDVHPEMSRLTLRVLGRLLFGSDMEQALPVVAWTFPLLGASARARAIAPVRLPRGWPTPVNRRAVRARRTLHRVCDALIAGRSANGGGADDLLTLLVAARDRGEIVDDVEIRDQLLIFLLAGHDTTALALTFALHLLGRHPDVQRRLRDEVDGVLGDRLPGAADEARLPYAAMVLKEAMRLYPPAWGLARRTAGGDRIGGYEIPAGEDVILSQWVTHRHPDVWRDPLRFDPERFTPARERERPRHAYFPFGGGPRACIGQRFSLLEAAIALAAIVQSFDVTSMSERLALAPQITLHPAGAVPCTLTARG
jgi:cytochrome P450